MADWLRVRRRRREYAYIVCEYILNVAANEDEGLYTHTHARTHTALQAHTRIQSFVVQTFAHGALRARDKALAVFAPLLGRVHVGRALVVGLGQHGHH